MKILFVCTGNTCRSPMAAGLFLSTHPDIVSESAGLLAADGLPASAHAITAAATFGADIAAHRSRRLTSKIADDVDVIVALGDYHAQVLQLTYPHKSVILLGNGIDDPYGEDLEAYQECAMQIFDALKNLKL
ncbi:MAG: low molecular weight phosphatase family protein [Oscillospiraceae bacterium]|jgi:protein-tyrosine phosphatase|nr:low molecular weight phosphatase family protein [Oscillospiraceae bacterium]